jgi:Flp pilus assembly protein TadG
MTKRSLFTTKWKRRIGASNGQGLVEFAVALPLLLLLALGVVEVGYALLDSHVVTKLAREGSNLISRDTSLQDAATAMRNLSSRPVNLDNGSKLIFSVIKKGATAGTANFDKEILYQRYEYGTLAGATSAVMTKGNGSFRGAPDYEAVNSDSDANLQITNLPVTLSLVRGGMIYVTEIYTRHPLITPVDRFGLRLPQTLYSIAYF